MTTALLRLEWNPRLVIVTLHCVLQQAPEQLSHQLSDLYNRCVSTPVMVAAMKFIVVVLTLHLLCEDVLADVAASGLNSVRLPDIAFFSVGL